MNEILRLLMAWVAGGVLGVVFFGGLWWTLQRGVSSPRPALWFLQSILLRMSLVLVGFYFVGRGKWESLAACLLGFILARFVVMRAIRTPSLKDKSQPNEVRHAP